MRRSWLSSRQDNDDRDVTMVRRTTRWRIPPIKVLSLPTSQRIEFCYAFEGKAHYHGPSSERP